jgi:hypothetical protein
MIFFQRELRTDDNGLSYDDNPGRQGITYSFDESIGVGTSCASMRIRFDRLCGGVRLSLAHRIIVMARGAVIAEGTPSEIR